MRGKWILFLSVMLATFNWERVLGASEEYYWYEGSIKRQVYLRDDKVAVLSRGAVFGQNSFSLNRADESVKGPRRGKLKIMKKSDFNRELGKMAVDLRATVRTSPVFTTLPGGSFLMTLPGGVLVYMDQKMNEQQVQEWAKKNQLQLRPKNSVKLVQENAWIIETAPGWESLELANQLREKKEVKRSMPNWWYPIEVK